MAFFAKKKKARVIKKIVHYFLFLNIVTQFVTCFGSLGLRDDGFLAKNENDMYGFNVKNTLQDSLKQKHDINSDILFTPAYLNFGDKSIGMPHIRTVWVHNTDPHTPLHLLSISGSSSHYHCSFFQDKLVPPLGNTSFEVCFLARHLGTINTVLYVHSSRGSTKFNIFGAGAPNPYRVSPLLGARVPLYGRYSPLIHLHNPHPSVLQVQEVYSSGSDLLLELPTGQTEASKELWQLAPYETKLIMRATFVGKVQENHTAFIRIKTDKETSQEMLVLPFQVEVLAEPDIFSSTDTLDFGLLKNSDSEVSLPIKLYNSASKSIQVFNMTIEPPTKAVTIQFRPVRLKANLLSAYQVATVSFLASKAQSERDCRGHVVVWSTAQNNKLYIPFQAHVFFGSLWYDESKMWFSDMQPYNGVEEVYEVGGEISLDSSNDPFYHNNKNNNNVNNSNKKNSFRDSDKKLSQKNDKNVKKSDKNEIKSDYIDIHDLEKIRSIEKNMKANIEEIKNKLGINRDSHEDPYIGYTNLLTPNDDRKINYHGYEVDQKIKLKDPLYHTATASSSLNTLPSKDSGGMQQLIEKNQGLVVQRKVRMQNLFQVPLVVFNVTLAPSALKFFFIDEFNPPLLWKAGQLTTLFSLNFYTGRRQHPFTSHLTIHTNLSSFTIPVHSYNGKLNVYQNTGSLLETPLDLGTLSISEERNINFTIVNNNPLDISIYNLETSYKHSWVRILSTQHTNGSNYQDHSQVSQAMMKNHHKAIFQLSLITPSKEQSLNAHILLQTKYQNLKIPFRLKTVLGSLIIQPSSLSFHGCFPGKVTVVDLHMNSTFDQALRITNTAFLGHDHRFSINADNQSPVLSPYKSSNIGRLYIDPGKLCGEECYSGLQTNTPGGMTWLRSLKLGRSVLETDLLLYSKASQLWRTTVSTGSHVLNATMQLDTDHVQGFLYPITAHLTKPFLASQSHLSFPFTHIGQTTTSELILENPSDGPVIIQLLFCHSYPDFHTLHSSLPSVFSHEYLDYDPHETFSINNISLFNSSQVSIYHRETILSSSTHPNTTTIILNAHQKLSARIIFQPVDTEVKNSYLLIRNNLTILEAVSLHGRGSYADIRLNGKRAGSGKPFHFEMSEKQLKNCEKSSANTQVQLQDFTLRRTFTLFNAGNISIFIISFAISGSFCEGHGFKIIECYPTYLTSNSSKKINIIFSPDFVMSRTRQMFEVVTGLGVEINFLFQATIPSHMMRSCYQSLPRPKWEGTLYYSVIFSMLVMFFSVTITSHFEANRLIIDRFNMHRLELFYSGYDKSKVLDLKNLRPSSSTSVNKSCNRKISLENSDHPSRESINHTCNHHSINHHALSTQQTPSSDHFRFDTNPSLLFYLFNKLLSKLKGPDSTSKQRFSISHSNNKLNKKDSKDNSHQVDMYASTNGQTGIELNHKRLEQENNLTLRKIEKNKKSKQNSALSLLQNSIKINENTDDVSENPADCKHHKSEAKASKHKETKKHTDACKEKEKDENRVSPDQPVESLKSKKVKTKAGKNSSISTISNCIVGIATPISSSSRKQSSTTVPHTTHNNIPHTTHNSTTAIITSATASLAASIMATTATITAITSSITSPINNIMQSYDRSKSKKCNPGELPATLSSSNPDISYIKTDAVSSMKNSRKTQVIPSKDRKKTTVDPIPHTKSLPTTLSLPKPQQTDTLLNVWDSPSFSINSMNEIVAQTKAFAKSNNATTSSTRDKPSLKNNPEHIRCTTSFSSRLFRRGEVVTSSVLRTTSMDSSTFTTPNTKPVSTTRPIAAVGATVRRSWNSTTTSFQHPFVNGINSASFQSTLLPSANSYSRNNYIQTQSYMLNQQEAARSLMNNAGLIGRPPTPEKQLTLMQKLMAERRQRQSEYQKRLMPNPYQDDWPGFDGSPNLSPSTLLPSQTWNSTWLPNNNLYETSHTSTTNYQVSPPLPGMLSSIWENTEPSNSRGPEESSYLVFDPFNTLENRGNIWHPTSAVSSMNNGWAGCPLTKSKKE